MSIAETYSGSIERCDASRFSRDSLRRNRLQRQRLLAYALTIHLPEASHQGEVARHACRANWRGSTTRGDRLAAIGL